VAKYQSTMDENKNGAGEKLKITEVLLFSDKRKNKNSDITIS